MRICGTDYTSRMMSAQEDFDETRENIFFVLLHSAEGTQLAVVHSEISEVVGRRSVG